MLPLCFLRYLLFKFLHASVAQRRERRASDAEVAGESPAGSTNSSMKANG